MEGYALVFISHSKDKTFTRKDNTSYNQIVPSCSTAYNEIIKNMSDIMGYIEIENGKRKLILRSNDESVDCKCRFKMIAPEIDFTYDALVSALNEAIDKEAVSTNNQYVTDEKQAAPTVREYNYDALMEEFQSIVGILTTNANAKTNAAKITHVIDKYLGKGKKIAEATIEQAEFIYLIVEELKDEFKSELN